jgi:hypothetical protein
MTPEPPTTWPAIKSSRDPLPRSMSYMVRVGHLSRCFGLASRPESWLMCSFKNTIKNFTGAERTGKAYRISTILHVHQDPDSTFDFHPLFIDSRPWKDAVDPLIVHAYIDSLPTAAARRCRDAILSALTWLSDPRQIETLTPGNSRAWSLTLDVDPAAGSATMRAFSTPVREANLVREVTFQPDSAASSTS